MARHARLVAIHVHRVEVGINKFALVKRHIHPRQIGMQVLIHSGEWVYAPGAHVPPNGRGRTTWTTSHHMRCFGPARARRWEASVRHEGVAVEGTSFTSAFGMWRVPTRLSCYRRLALPLPPRLGLTGVAGSYFTTRLRTV
jgi:hypothetical protein